MFFSGLLIFFRVPLEITCRELPLLMGSVVGMCVLLRDDGRQEKNLKTVGLENYITLAVHLFVNPFRKMS